MGVKGNDRNKYFFYLAIIIIFLWFPQLILLFIVGLAGMAGLDYYEQNKSKW